MSRLGFGTVCALWVAVFGCFIAAVPAPTPPRPPTVNMRCWPEGVDYEYERFPMCADNPAGRDV